MKLLEGPSFYEFGNENPTDLVVFLHGYGSCGNDLITLSQHLKTAFKKPYFIAPNAPEEYEFIGSTFPNEFQWYSLINRNSESLLIGSKKASVFLNYFLDEKLKEFNLTNQNLYLIGFSQGTMVSLYTALRRENGGCKAIIAFAGSVIAPELLKKEIISFPKVCVIHGDKDAIVPIALGKLGYNYLIENNIEAEFHKISGLQHYLDYEAVEVAKNYLISIQNKL